MRVVLLALAFVISGLFMPLIAAIVQMFDSPYVLAPQELFALWVVMGIVLSFTFMRVHSRRRSVSQGH